MINFVYSFNNCNKSHNYLGVLDCAEHIVMSLNVILCKKKKKEMLVPIMDIF